MTAYFLAQSGRLTVDRALDSVVNAAGAALLLVPLSVDFNPGAVVIEGFWLAISVYGFARSRRLRAAAPRT